MASEPCYHERYFTRIVPESIVITNGSAEKRGERLQLICEYEGVIFHEVEIKEKP